jgi:hypothetical protein
VVFLGLPNLLLDFDDSFRIVYYIPMIIYLRRAFIFLLQIFKLFPLLVNFFVGFVYFFSKNLKFSYQTIHIYTSVAIQSSHS